MGFEERRKKLQSPKETNVNEVFVHSTPDIGMKVKNYSPLLRVDTIVTRN